MTMKTPIKKPRHERLSHGAAISSRIAGKMGGLLHAVEQINRPEHCLARLWRRLVAERLSYMALQHFSRYAIHGGAGSENLRHYLLAGLSFRQHIDDAANLSLDAPQT